MGWGSTIGTVGGGIAGGIAGGPAGAVGGAALGGYLGGKAEGAMAKASTTVYQKLDPTAGAHQYGGQDSYWDPNQGKWVTGADQRGDRYDQLGDYYANRGAIQADYGQANEDYARQMQAREGQSALSQQYADVIAGKAPSIAEMQMRQGQDDAAQQALNLAASSRGGGSLLAQQQALQTSALGNQAVTRDAAMLRASEVAQARDAQGNLLANMRGGDQASRGQSADQANAQAGYAMQSRTGNDAMGLGYRQSADAVREGQRDSNVGVSQGNQSARTALSTGAQQAEAQKAAATRQAVGQAGAGAIGAYYSGGK